MNNLFYQVILSSDSKGPGATRIQEIRGDKGARVSYSIFFLISTYILWDEVLESKKRG